jgi:hypothetical protein
MWNGRKGTKTTSNWAVMPTESPPTAPERPQTRATSKVATTTRKRGMNKMEAQYAQRLDLEKHAGEILWWGYEAIRLRLANGAWFKPDFAVEGRFGLEFHETKGHMREAAHVRIKVAASLYPMFRFSIIRLERGEWTRMRVPG